MGKSLVDNGFITEMKDKNGDSWYHQIVLEAKEEETERLNNDIKVLLKENENKEKVIKIQDNIIKEVRELLNQEWYSVLRKETIRKAREILDKE